MPLPLDQFIKSPYCKQLTLSPEDQPQDERDWKRLLQQDQERQYARYMSQFEPDELRNDKNGLHNTKPTLRKGNEKWNAYMREYRKKKKCRHCGKLNP